MMTFADIIALWPSAEQFGKDLNLKRPDYGRGMKHRNKIPRVHWPLVVEAAARRVADGTRERPDIQITLELLEAIEAAGEGSPKADGDEP